MGKRCQVCDGPIVNGRCKYCGMPYRNDMELYHLNEDRSEHYRHASAKVKKVMAESEIPLPDRNKTAKKPGKTAAVKTQKTSSGTQTARTQKTVGQSYDTRTVRTYQTSQKTTQKKKKKEGKASKVFWSFILVLMVAAGLLAEHWDTIGYRIEDFIYDTFDIDIDLDSFFGDSSAEKADENDREEAVKTSDSEQKYEANDPYYYIFDGEDYIIGEAYTITETADEDSEDIEFEFTIEPGIYILESGWGGALNLEVKSSSGKDETVKFDEPEHKEKVELHAGDEVSAVASDGQENYLVMYQIQQYDE